MVRVVGLEPTLLAERDFESRASTSFTTPAFLPPFLAAALCTYTAPSAIFQFPAARPVPSQASQTPTLLGSSQILWMGKQTAF